jgi:hypothetical protein
MSVISGSDAANLRGSRACRPAAFQSDFAAPAGLLRVSHHLLVGAEDVESGPFEGELHRLAGPDRGLALDLDGGTLAAGEGDVDVGLAAELLGDLDLSLEDALAGRRGDEVLGADAEGDRRAGLRRVREVRLQRLAVVEVDLSLMALDAADAAGIRFIRGLPMKPATKMLAGLL